MHAVIARSAATKRSKRRLRTRGFSMDCFASLVMTVR
jgi:hypothetical protein